MSLNRFYGQILFWDSNFDVLPTTGIYIGARAFDNAQAAKSEFDGVAWQPGWGNDVALQEHIDTVTNNPHNVLWTDLGGEQPAPITHTHPISEISDNASLVLESELLGVSEGAASGGKPIKLNNAGQIDASMIDASTFYFVTGWDPSDADGPNDDNTGCDPLLGCEYPDVTGHTFGAFWFTLELSAPDDPNDDPIVYTFTTGDLAGLSIRHGDFMVWGSAGWAIMRGEMNPKFYYRIDGANPLTADFQAGQHKLVGVLPGSAAGEAVTFDQIADFSDDFVHASGDIMSGNLMVGNGVSGSEISARANTAGSAFDLRDVDSNIIGKFAYDSADSAIKIVRYDTTGTGISKIELKPTGNVEILSGIDPIDAVDLTPKGWVDNRLNTKENVLGNPAADGYILSSTDEGTRSWIPLPTAAIWGNITGDIGLQTDMQDEFVNASGDTMTGSLIVNDGTAGGNAIVQVSSGVNSATMKQNYFELRSDIHNFRIEDDFTNTKTDFKFDDDIVMSIGLGMAPSTEYAPNSDNQLTRKDYVDTQVATREPGLGVPATSGMVLSSTDSGTRSWISVSQTYSNSNPTPADHGGIPAGSTFSDVPLTQMWTDVLYPYQHPSFSDFTIGGIGTVYEVGHNIPAGAYSFAWTTVNEDNIVDNSIAIVDVTSGTTLATGLANDGAETLDLLDMISDIQASQQWRIEAENTKNGTFNKSYTTNWYWATYTGNDADGDITEADIKAGIKSLRSTGNGNYTPAVGDQVYKWVAYASEHGLASSITDPGGTTVVMDPTWNPKEVTITNDEGVSIIMNVYRTLYKTSANLTMVVEGTTVNGDQDPNPYAPIPGTLPISGMIAPLDAADKYPVTDDKYNKGGYRTVQTIAERDGIDGTMRKDGMLVYVIDDDTKYILKAGAWVVDGGQLPTGGATGDVLVKLSGNNYDVGWATIRGLEIVETTWQELIDAADQNLVEKWDKYYITDDSIEIEIKFKDPNDKCWFEVITAEGSVLLKRIGD